MQQQKWLVVGIVAALVVVTGIIVFARSGDSNGEDIVPAGSQDGVQQPASESPTTSPGDTPWGVDVAELTPGMQASIGQDLVIYYSPLGVGKGAPLSRIYRAYRSSDGLLHTEELLQRHDTQFGGPLQSIAVDFERGRVLVAACITGQCGFEGSTPAEGARFRMLLSQDGGVTFEPFGELPPSDLFLLGFVGEEVLALSYSPLGSNSGERAFLYPSMREPPRPPGLAEATPLPDGAGGLVWRNDAGYHDEAGKLVLPAGAFEVTRTGLPAGFLAQWRTPGANEAYLGIYDGAPSPKRVFRIHGSSFMTRSQLPDGLLAGTLQLREPFGFGVDSAVAACKRERPIYASLLNPETGVVHPIIELGDCDFGHAGLHAVLARPVLRVATGGDCLNVRKEPSSSAASLGCFADGVLLFSRGDGPPAVVPGWLPVVTPALEPGWVKEEFVGR
jgi:hypothetical protein